MKNLDFYFSNSPNGPVIGLGRSVLGLGTLLTLAFNGTDTLFFMDQSRPARGGLDSINFFRLIGLSDTGLLIGKLVAMIILVMVVIGWRPRVTGILHWWVVYSFAHISSTIDGGDSIASILTLFLVPLTLLDGRKWHWDAATTGVGGGYGNMFLWSVLFILRLQVSFIYFHAGVDKFKVDEWLDGTSTYYWFNNDTFGSSGIFKSIFSALTASPMFVTLTTWGTLVLEILLSMAILMDRKYYNWRILLLISVLFHVGIIVVFGLVSFFMTMAACLIFYLIPISQFDTKKSLLNIFKFRLRELFAKKDYSF